MTLYEWCNSPGTTTEWNHFHSHSVPLGYTLHLSPDIEQTTYLYPVQITDSSCGEKQRRWKKFSDTLFPCSEGKHDQCKIKSETFIMFMLWESSRQGQYQTPTHANFKFSVVFDFRSPICTTGVISHFSFNLLQVVFISWDAKPCLNENMFESLVARWYGSTLRGLPSCPTAYDTIISYTMMDIIISSITISTSYSPLWCGACPGCHSCRGQSRLQGRERRKMKICPRSFDLIIIIIIIV